VITALADRILALIRADELARGLERLTGTPRRATLALARTSLRLSLLSGAASLALALALAAGAAPPPASEGIAHAASLTLWLSLASLCIAPLGIAAIGTVSRWIRRM
jgi:hypothetical protein